jgi:hypothetical protein
MGKADDGSFCGFVMMWKTGAERGISSFGRQIADVNVRSCFPSGGVSYSLLPGC